jgi:hypothetical protein
MSVQTDRGRNQDAKMTPSVEPGPRAWRYWPPLAILGMAVVLILFVALSKPSSEYPFNRFEQPPIYGRFVTDFSIPLGLWLIPAGLLLAAIAWVVTSARRIPSWLALALIVAAAWLTSIAVNLVRGDKRELYQGVSTNPNAPYYTRDLHFVDQYGVRGFVEHFPTLIKQLGAYNGKTHPPGVQVFLWTVSKVVGDHAFRFATVLAIMSLLTALGAWAMARSYGGERAGRIAAVLAVAAPGPLMLAYSNMDVIFAAFFSISAALFVVGSRRRSLALMAAAGAVAGFCTFLTYATAFLVMAAVVAVVVETRSVRQSLRLLGAAAVGGIVVLLVLRLALGFDLLACYQAMARSSGKFFPYWMAGHPASVLLWAGLPAAALGLAGLVIKVPEARRPVLPLLLIAGMFVWGLLPPVTTGLRQGEVERTWAFLYPMLAVSAGPVVARWTDSTRLSRIWAGSVVFALVVLSVAQAGLLQALWDNKL